MLLTRGVELTRHAAGYSVVGVEELSPGAAHLVGEAERHRKYTILPHTARLVKIVTFAEVRDTCRGSESFVITEDMCTVQRFLRHCCLNENKEYSTSTSFLRGRGGYRILVCVMRPAGVEGTEKEALGEEDGKTKVICIRREDWPGTRTLCDMKSPFQSGRTAAVVLQHDSMLCACGLHALQSQRLHRSSS